jgi:SAM-dependent methyltransferase
MSPERASPRGEVWTERTVGWYERANARSDYAERVFAAATDLLAGCRSALDVGAGFGALALPLARRLERVTALEPSRPMAAALRRAIGRQSLDNVAVVEAAWGDVAVGPHDLVVCAHVGPLLRGGSRFLADVGQVARRGVLLVSDTSGGDDKFFFSELYPRLLGRPYERCCQDEAMLAALRKLGVEPAVTTIAYRSDQPLESLDEACDFWMTYMGLDKPEARLWLRAFLAGRLRREGQGWLAPFRKRATVIRWDVRPGRDAAPAPATSDRETEAHGTMTHVITATGAPGDDCR